MSQQTAIVTGAGGAIASHVIAAFHQAGWKLALVAFNDAERTRLVEAHPDACVVQANLADDADAQRAVGEMVEQCGKVDALLNIAGGFDMSGAAETTPAQLDAQLDINLRTVFNATRAVLPHMLGNGGGFVLGVGAAAAIDGGASMGAYAASKAAMIAWLKSMHAELAPRGIEMGIVYPMAAVDTAGNRAAMPDADPSAWIDPAELGATMLHLASRSARGRVREARVYPPVG
ncbi:MAG TPA: SDR family NAD(P)-dependent oxidoreductase [Rhodanobacteraceae bacterium]|nr:SDR family NAD(P)-dependent oxidoreductase [Rhodanobacteraceae bacterium]